MYACASDRHDKFECEQERQLHAPRSAFVLNNVGANGDWLLLILHG
jgi:hypothetical protein